MPAPDFQCQALLRRYQTTFDDLVAALGPAPAGVVFRVTPAQVEHAKRLLYARLDKDEDEKERQNREDILAARLGALVGEDLSVLDIRKTAALISGNWHQLENGRDWDSPGTTLDIPPRWTAVFIPTVQRMLTVKSQMCWVELEGRYGFWAGHRFKIVRSTGFLFNMLKEVTDRRFIEEARAEDIAGMFFGAALRREAGETHLVTLAPSKSQIAFNRKLLRARQGSCIKDEFAGAKCTNCYLGRNMCELSRHENSYIVQEVCAVCTRQIKKHRGYMPERNEGVCLACLNRGNLPLAVRKKEHLDGKRRG